MRTADKEQGASLLSVLVIVMLMSVAAVAATDALARSVMVIKSSSARAETFWTARGAAQAAGTYLTKAMTLNEGALNAESELFAQPTTLPAGNGVVVVQAHEASNCFNLNALINSASDGEVNDASLESFDDMLVAAGFDDAESESLAQKLADWVDADGSTRTYGAEDGYYVSQAEPYRAANTKLRSISELKAIAGYDAEIVAQIESLVCLRPAEEQSVLNINTLTVEQAPLLVALYSSELSLDDARAIIDSRPTGGWLNKDTFTQQDAIMKIAPDVRDEMAISLVSNYLSADISVGTGGLVTDYRALYQRAETGAVSLVSLVRREF
ncbi:MULTISPECIES: type II secretion system minor pseudopilin GspK [Hyphomonas]|nr:MULTISPECIES: type II secretion system minor pseudopilin GspK [Hyphomonas]|tara:strand:+ start:10491 stop:11468 length:978 start_codon:yes stop_codon:yes gene_type:complete